MVFGIQAGFGRELSAEPKCGLPSHKGRGLVLPAPPLPTHQIPSEPRALQPPACRLSAPYTLEDIEGFGDASRELFVRSSCYSVVPITVGPVGPQDGPTVTWVFTSEPKSISFSVVYREDPLTPPEDAKVGYGGGMGGVG